MMKTKPTDQPIQGKYNSLSCGAQSVLQHEESHWNAICDCYWYECDDDDNDDDDVYKKKKMRWW